MVWGAWENENRTGWKFFKTGTQGEIQNTSLDFIQVLQIYS